MKIIFLDLDGVLRLFSGTPDGLAGHGGFDPGCVARFNRILEQTSAQFVIVSTLRRLHTWPELWDALSIAGVDMTKAHPEANVNWTGIRVRDVDHWLRDHAVQEWCILDDELRHYEYWDGDERMAHVFVPSTRHGLQDSTAQRVIHFLNTSQHLQTHDNINDSTL